MCSNLMNDKIKSMLDNKCPQCKSTAGDIISCFPIITQEQVEIDMYCNNCGCACTIFCVLTGTKFKPNI